MESDLCPNKQASDCPTASSAITSRCPVRQRGPVVRASGRSQETWFQYQSSAAVVGPLLNSPSDLSLVWSERNVKVLGRD